MAFQLPPLRGTSADGDNNGAVITLTIGEVGFLLSADIHWDGEYDLLKRRAVGPIMVLKVAHHGAATSTTPEFLAVAHPAIAAISGAHASWISASKASRSVASDNRRKRLPFR